ncbi:hypothetical protein [Streptomyces oceani]|uniref:Integral membrane protein n=1 Tax=Streptomyces oceani TaxID=1075402 RepID=A0A1E7JZF1_9ACTN|nr:hypothetical protein [Streptomyces oceani]OEU97068.1 hypothetical protein AN216_17665 [Streptomyces oceani]
MGISTAGVRTTRAAVFTALCVTLSAGAHVLLTSTPVPLGALSAVSAAVFLLAFAFADRERGFVRIAALLIPLELFADTVFTTGQHTCYGQNGGPVTGPLRSLGVDLVCAGEVGAPLARMLHGSSSLPTASGASVEGSPWLLLAAHVTVGLLAAAWLRRGEAAVARLLRAAAALAFRPLLLAVAGFVPAAGPSARTTRVRAVRVRPAYPLLDHSVLSRGPPAARATA